MKQEYILVRNFIDLDKCNQLVNRMDAYRDNGLSVLPDNQCPNSTTFYGIFNDESILWKPQIEELVGKSLFPTYTYSRIYPKGEGLLPHIDRWECEYSFTLALKYDKENWPFYVQTSNGPIEAFLEPGDILIYKGLENMHWRLPLTTEFHYQGFFHYVDANGPYAHKKYDGRHAFATTEEATQEILRRQNVL